jgi:putative two-component system response regulator
MTADRCSIIMVDDNTATLAIGRNMLKTFYKVYPAPSAAEMFNIMKKHLPDLILLDIDMPVMNGFETIKQLKADPRFVDIPVIFLTAKDDDDSELEGLNLSAADYIFKPFSASLLLKRVSNQLLLIRQKRELLAAQAELEQHSRNLEDIVRSKTSEVVMLQHAVLATVADLVEFRDNQTGGHISRTENYLKALTDELLRQSVYRETLADWNMDFFLQSALLHDVGKIAISDQILNKPGKLTPDEFEVMKTHVTVGVDAIERILCNTNEHAFLRHALLVVGTHHEKWDGSGYPMGLKGRNIPLEGRLMAVADVYDALVAVRPYKRAFSHEEARKIIEDSAGKHFDPVLVELFKRVEGSFARTLLEKRDKSRE